MFTITLAERIERELAEQRRALEENLQTAHGRRNAALVIRAKPHQLEHKRAELQKQLDAATVRTFEESEQLRRQVFDTGQEILAAQPAAEQARLEVQKLDTEILNCEAELKQVEQEIFNRQKIDLLRAVIERAEPFLQAQRALNGHIQVGRDRGYRVQDLGVVIMAHPAATRADPRENAVMDYLKFSLARLDPEYARTLGPNDPARRTLEAAERGAGVSAPGLNWA